MWNIEKIVSKGDYDYAVIKEHPNATKRGYVLLHRAIVENHLGRLLNTNEVVHHNTTSRKNAYSGHGYFGEHRIRIYCIF